MDATSRRRNSRGQEASCRRSTHNYIWFIFLLQFGSSSQDFRPVVIIHGILDHASTLLGLKQNIEQFHPGTQVTLIPIFETIKSAWPMWIQVVAYGNIIRNISDRHPEGIVLIGYSQGGLISRGLIQSDATLNVHTFISLASPQMGQYGDTQYLRYLFPHVMKEHLYKILYTRIGQTFSVGGYWKDPHHLRLYQNACQYLAVLNNETTIKIFNTTNYKQNFLRLRKFIAIGGPDDGVVTPWQSSLFGFYDDNETVVEMPEQPVYQDNPFGLRTLDERGDLLILKRAGVRHLQWHVDITVFHDLIAPWLT